MHCAHRGRDEGGPRTGVDAVTIDPTVVMNCAETTFALIS